LLASASALVLALASCGPPPPPPNTPQGQCDRIVADDPEVAAARERQQRMVINSPGGEDSGLAPVLRRKMSECLRIRGVMTPGGVQPVQR
jgi:hypothetical protein